METFLIYSIASSNLPNVNLLDYIKPDLVTLFFFSALKSFSNSYSSPLSDKFLFLSLINSILISL